MESNQHSHRRCSIQVQRTPIPRLLRWFLLSRMSVQNVRMVKLLKETHKISLQHGHRHFSNLWYINNSWYFQQRLFVDIFEGRNIDDDGAWFSRSRGKELVLRSRNLKRIFPKKCTRATTRHRATWGSLKRMNSPSFIHSEGSR